MLGNLQLINSSLTYVLWGLKLSHVPRLISKVPYYSSTHIVERLCFSIRIEAALKYNHCKERYMNKIPKIAVYQSGLEMLAVYDNTIYIATLLTSERIRGSSVIPLQAWQTSHLPIPNSSKTTYGKFTSAHHKPVWAWLAMEESCRYGWEDITNNDGNELVVRSMDHEQKRPLRGEEWKQMQIVVGSQETITLGTVH